MKLNFWFLLFFLVNISSVCSQINIKIFSKEIKGGFLIYAENNEYCPVSVRFDFELKNLKSSKGNHKIFILPERKKNILITVLSANKSGSYSFKYKTRYNYGNHALNSFDINYVYDLPFANGAKFLLSQGYNGSRTHQDENSLDFKMPIGTKIHASRGGVVVSVIDENSINCYMKECSKYNNQILIYHTDGTFSTYLHLKKNGALVSVGDSIVKNQEIALSGNTGFSSGPHLHFSVFKQRLGKRITIPTKFKIDSNKEVYLQEGKVYSKNIK